MYNNIPQEMRRFKQWVCWRFEDMDAKKPTKVPYSAHNNRLASVTNPDTWCTWEQTYHAITVNDWYDGIGFVLTNDDPYAFLDLDDTKGDQQALDRQIKVFNEFDSYAERSPSASGLHIIVKGKLPSGRRRGSMEIYTNARYMTMTGNVYRDAPISDHNDLLNVLYDQMSTSNNKTAMYSGIEAPTESDEQVIQHATNAANGNKFSDLYAGNWHVYYHSQSEADFALVDIIAFYSHNRAQIQRIFRASGLGQREKAQRQDYINYMLNKCFDRMLPPVDIDGLQNKLNEALELKAQKELEQAKSLNNTVPAIDDVKVNQQEMKLTNDTYSLPPGLVGEIAKFIYEAAPRPVAEIALAGALGMIAGIVGRAYNVSGTGLNQYMLLLAPTGTGKEAIASGIDKLFAAVLRTVPASGEFVGPSEIASSQAIIKYMSKGPSSFVSLVGEFGIYLQQMASVNAAPHLMGLRRFLLDAYNKSGEGKILRPSIYSDKEKNTQSVISPSFSILGESTPEKFYEGLHEGLISEGLLPRFTTIEYKGDRPPLSANFSKVKPSFELVDKLSTLCAHALMLNSQNKAIHVEFTPDAKALLDKFDKHCDDNINSSDKEIRRHLWNRAHVKSMKMAALIAVGCNPYDPKITVDVADWAINVIVADCRNLLDKFNAGEIGIDNDETKQLTKIIDGIRDYVIQPWKDVATYAGATMSPLHNDRLIPYSYLQRKLACVAVFRKDRIGSSGSIKRAITTLIERGDIQEVSRGELSEKYGTTARAFMIAHPKTFEL